MFIPTEKHKEVNGIFYLKDTKDEVIKVIEDCIKNNYRVRIFYGEKVKDRYTVKNQYNATIGYLRKSHDCQSEVILIPKKRSRQYFSVKTDSVIRIVRTNDRKVLFTEENIYFGKHEIIQNEYNGYSLLIDGIVTNRCKRKDILERYSKYLQGISFIQ